MSQKELIAQGAEAVFNFYLENL